MKRGVSPHGYEYFPLGEKIWLVFDLANGHEGVRQYVWWFRGLAHAREFIRDAKRRRRAGEDIVAYSKPIRFGPVK